MSRLAGKTALIAGAATGMGRATAELFARNGATVIAFGLGGRALDEAAAITNGKAVHGDITKASDVARAIAVCGDQLDVVVNAAGLWARRVGRMAGVDLPVLPMQHHYLVT